MTLAAFAQWCSLAFVLSEREKRLTTQAQRAGPHDVWIASRAHRPGALERWLAGNIRLNLNILGESLKALPVFLFNGDRNMTGLAGLNVVNCPRFAGVCAADNFALGTVFEFVWSF